MEKSKGRSLIAVNIIRMREERGWSQLTLAEKANVHVNVVKKIETGKSQGWPKTRERIAKAFGCKADDLVQMRAPPITPSLTQKQMAELITSLQNENDYLRNQLAHSQIASPERPYAPLKPKK